MHTLYIAGETTATDRFDSFQRRSRSTRIFGESAYPDVNVLSSKGA